jgi:hypothetical protein
MEIDSQYHREAHFNILCAIYNTPVCSSCFRNVNAALFNVKDLSLNYEKLPSVKKMFLKNRNNFHFNTRKRHKTQTQKQIQNTIKPYI